MYKVSKCNVTQRSNCCDGRRRGHRHYRDFFGQDPPNHANNILHTCVAVHVQLFITFLHAPVLVDGPISKLHNTIKAAANIKLTSETHAARKGGHQNSICSELQGELWFCNLRRWQNVIQSIQLWIYDLRIIAFMGCTYLTDVLSYLIIDKVWFLYHFAKEIIDFSRGTVNVSKFYQHHHKQTYPHSSDQRWCLI